MVASTSPTFAARIALLEDEHTNRGRSTFDEIEPLTTALGCRTLVFKQTAWRVTHPKQPDAADEALVVEALLRALRYHRYRFAANREDSYSILDGLTRNNRWRACLDSREKTYSLALLLIEIAVHKRDVAANGGVSALLDVMEPDVCVLMGAWLDQDTPEKIPTVNEMARYFFNDLWCDLHLSDDSLTAVALTRLILRETPPFLSGIMRTQFEPVGAPLPDMELA
jgi:hypothetical protein